MVVLPGGVDDQVRFELVEYGQNHVFERCHTDRVLDAAVSGNRFTVGIEQHDERIGFSDVPLDADGVIRRGLLYLWDEDDRAHTSLALRLALAALEPLGTDQSKPFLETAPYLIAIFLQKYGTLPDGREVVTNEQYTQQALELARSGAQKLQKAVDEQPQSVVAADPQHEVRLAEDVAQARAFLDAEPIDLVLTDIVMPGDEDGLDLLRESRRVQPGTPVIVIAEDNRMSQKILLNTLKNEDMKVHMVGNGQEVLDFLYKRADGPKRQPNKQYLLLLDIRMPKVDGIEVLREIKAGRLATQLRYWGAFCKPIVKSLSADMYKKAIELNPTPTGVGIRD